MRKTANLQNKDVIETQQWHHPGGKLRELGAASLSDAELLSILISSGIKGKPAEKIAEEILAKFNSFKGMANQSLEKFLEIKGLADVKIIRIAAAFEIARRCANLVIKDLKEDKELRKEVFGE
jgi:DNA repair protein RadC